MNEDDDRFQRIRAGLFRAASMTADEFAAKKGEDHFFTKIKRNRERLEACDRHEFETDPNWRSKLPFLNSKTRCLRCGGEMKAGDAMLYLRGFAHASGQRVEDVLNRIWPPA